MKNQRQLLAALLLGLSILQPQLGTVFAQTTAFTYQGRLADGVNPASGIYALRFTLFDAPTDGTALAGPLTNATVSLNNGLFTVLLDFGADVFSGGDRWLEIGVRTNGAAGPFTVLAPRQLITPAPLALGARSAASAATVTSVPLSALPSSVPRLDTNSLLYFEGDMTIGQIPLSLTEGFESVAFPPAGWNTWQGLWSRTTNTHSEGSAAAVSGPIGYGWTSNLELTYNFPTAGTVQFDWKVSSEPVWNILYVKVDGGPSPAIISGEVDWTSVTLPIGAGTHTIRWTYYKGSTNSTGSDCGWLDNVRVTTAKGGNLIVDSNVGIGTNAPAQLLHLHVTAGHGEGMRIDSALAGHAPAIYLNHTGTNGHNFRLASYGDNVNPGSFRIRDETVNADQLTIDSTGMVAIANSAVISGNLGIHTSPGSRTVEVNGPIGVMDGTRTLNAGIGTEVNSQMINIGINDGPLNRLGGAYSASRPGGFIRIDGRATGPLFGFFARSAGSSSDVTQVASISAGGTVTATAFNPTSDRDSKQNFQPLKARSVLEKVVALPLSEWAFKQEPAVRHAGPMAQDFHAAFGLGADNKHIATVDADGVALAAIQGLNEKLEKELQEKEARLQAMQVRLARVEALLEKLGDTANGGNR